MRDLVTSKTKTDNTGLTIVSTADFHLIICSSKPIKMRRTNPITVLIPTDHIHNLCSMLNSFWIFDTVYPKTPLFFMIVWHNLLLDHAQSTYTHTHINASFHLIRSYLATNLVHFNKSNKVRQLLLLLSYK